MPRSALVVACYPHLEAVSVFVARQHLTGSGAIEDLNGKGKGP
jgi:hypothetical protein